MWRVARRTCLLASGAQPSSTTLCVTGPRYHAAGIPISQQLDHHRHRRRRRTIAPVSLARYLSGRSGKSLKHIISMTEHDARFLKVVWEDGTENRYPFIYLRDNCTCPTCLDDTSQMRMVEIVEQGIAADIAASSVEVDEKGVVVTWPDGHQSHFSSMWLYNHKVSGKREDWRLNRFRPPPRKLWSAADFPAKKVTFELDAMLNDEQVQYDLLWAFYTYGVALVDGCGTKPLPTSVYEKLGLVQETGYGHFWEVKAIANPSNLAYSPKPFPLHTDLGYFKHTPGLLLLHCLEQAPTGGHTNMADGLHAAAKLRKENPYLYDLFTKLPVTWDQRGYDMYTDRHYDYEREQPIFTLNDHGEVEKILFSVSTRSSFLSVDPDQVHDLYAGIIRWMQICNEAEHRHELRLEPGQLLIMNNQRLMHGRGAINDTRESGRCLRGCYLAIDEVDSRLRYLHRKLQKQAQE